MGARRETTDDLEALMEALPPEIVDRLGALANRTDLLEVVMDLGRRPEARFTTGEEDLLDREITDADIAHVIDHIGAFGDDNRAGIERTLHRISAIRNRSGKVVGLTCRIGRAVFGTIDIIRDGADGARFLRLVLGRIGNDAIAAGILAPVRTYESAGTRAAEAVGFEPIGRVTLLVREVRAQVREPAMVPATR